MQSNTTYTPHPEITAQRAEARVNDTSFKAGLKSLQSGFEWLRERAQSLAEGVIAKKGDTSDTAWKESLKAKAQAGNVSPIPPDNTIPGYPIISDADVEKMTPEEAVHLAEEINRLEAQRAKAEKKAPRHRRRESAPGVISDEAVVRTEAYENAAALEAEASEWFKIRQPPHPGWKELYLECSGTTVTLRTVVEGHIEMQFDLTSDVDAIKYEEQEKSHTPTIIFTGHSDTRLIEIRLATVTNPPDLTAWMKKFHGKKAATSAHHERRESVP